MLIGLFRRGEAALDGGVPDHRWKLPEELIRFRSSHCVLAGDPQTPVAGDTRVSSLHRPGIVAVFDGRLDNREELLDSIGLPAETAASDEALICALYPRFGPTFAKRVSGEFRLVLYDEPERLLFACVDFACTRRLWWREHGSLVIVSSSLVELYAPDESLTIEEDYLIERLACGWNSGRHGPIQGATRLLPGETLQVSTRSLAAHRHWCPTMFVAAQGAGRTDDDYLDEFTHWLRDGVRRRLPAEGPVLCELSGGLDSTSITALAGGLLAGDTRDRLHAVTVSYPGAPDADERERAATVARAAGATHHVLEWHASEELFGGMPDNAFYWDEPRFNVHSHAMALAKDRLLGSIGTKIVFSGAGAEPVLCEDMAWPVFLADALIRGRWREVREGLGRWHGVRKAPFILLFYRACLGPLLRPAAAMTYEARQVIPTWLTPRARRRFAALQAGQLGPIVDRRNTAGAWMAEQWQAAGSAADQGYGGYAYETRFPFLHKPLVESVLEMPWSVKVRPNCNKLLLRRLAKTLLPAGFATRSTPGVDQAVGHALAAQTKRVSTYIDATALGQLGLVDDSLLRVAVSQAQHGFGRGLRFIVMTLAMELWTRSVLSGDWRRAQLRHLWPRTTSGR